MKACELLNLRKSKWKHLNHQALIKQKSSRSSSNPVCKLPSTNHQRHTSLWSSFAGVCGYNKLVTQTHKLGNLFIQQSMEEIQPLLVLFQAQTANYGGIIALCLATVSLATKQIHTASWSLWVTSVGVKEGEWQGYTYLLAADLRLQGGELRGQWALNK